MSLPAFSSDAEIPPELVRQRTPDQFFVTDWRLDPEGLTAVARLPLDHPRYSDTATPHHDIVLMADVVSQVGMLSAVALLSPQAEWEFLVRHLDVSLDPLDNNLRRPDSTQITVAAHEGQAGAKSRGSPSTGGAGFLTTRNSIGDKPSGTCHAFTYWVSSDRYQEMRRRLRKRLVPGESAPRQDKPDPLVGCANPDNALISALQPAGERRYETSVIVDLDDHTYFGHPLDHVNGLLLLDAAKQATIAAACRELGISPQEVVVRSAEMDFVSFAELDDLTQCSVEMVDEERTAVDLTQSGRAVAHAKLAVARP